MTKRDCSLVLMPLLALAGCASTAPKAEDPAPVWQESVGTGTTTEHTSVQKDNAQMLRSEHAMDADAPAVPDGENHGLP